MSWSDRARSITIPTLAVLAFTLSACTVQPLYGPGPTGAAVTRTLTNIEIDPVTTRAAQQVRNHLLTVLGGDGPPAYRLSLAVGISDAGLGITPVEKAPVYTVTVSVTWAVTSIETGEIVLRGTSSGTASWDRVNQLYANSRAHIDAEDRAAALAADDVRIRLSVAAAKGTI